LADNEMEDVILQLDHRISRLEGALRLEEKITASGGKIFAASGKRADFHAAVQACKEAGGAVATPRTAGENAAVRRLVKRYNAFAYLGIRESLIPGEFRSLGGAKLNYTHWHAREPSGKGEE
ncbi:SFTPA protein, partial [Crypturellus undulatus]|nr:SFTPA protein [Crypturellus undulatus]